VFALSGLGGENDVSRVNRGDGIKNIEKHWYKQISLNLFWFQVKNILRL